MANARLTSIPVITCYRPLILISRSDTATVQVFTLNAKFLLLSAGRACVRFRAGKNLRFVRKKIGL